MASKFIVTDPCYIVADDDFDKLIGCCDGEGLPMSAKPKPDGRRIKIHVIENTHADGRVEKYNIGVDAGMLCVAEGTATQWKNERLGFKCDSLAEAKGVIEDAAKIMRGEIDDEDEDDDGCCPNCGWQL